MNKDYLYKVIPKIELSEELIPKKIKTQSLNNIKHEIEEMLSLVSDQIIKTSLNSLLLSIEDAYNIHMYRFQFQLFVNIINKEIKNIKEMILYLEKIK